MRGLIAALVLALGAAAPAVAQQVEVASSVAADGSRTLVHEIVVPAPVEQVWTAVATVEGWRTWAAPVVEAKPGTTDRFETGYDPAVAPSIEQQWLERTAPHTAAFRTTRAPDGFPHADAYYRVVSCFELTPVGNGSTRVRLEGAGYPPGAAGDALIAFFREGNAVSLRQLHARFVDGPIDWTAGRQPKGEE